jgi:hypothetical protein
VNLREITEFAVSSAIIAKTEDALRIAGEEGYEMFVLWSGREKEGQFIFETAHAPKQTAYRSRDGLSVKVDGDELDRLNRWLLEHSEVLAAQVHAHPDEAFHSDTDDTYPIVTALGGLSLVAANFARDGLLSGSSALFRLDPSGWQQVERPNELLRVSGGTPTRLPAQDSAGDSDTRSAAATDHPRRWWQRWLGRNESR